MSCYRFESFKKNKVSHSPHYLVIGNPVGHSLSPLMHNKALDYYQLNASYFAVSVTDQQLSEFASWMNRDELLGANVTLPYKKIMMDFVDEVSETAAHAGAVNTIVKSGSKLTGHNTDITGFSAPLLKYKDKLYNSRAVVFGTGGASNAVVLALKNLNCSEIILISRRPEGKNPEGVFMDCIFAGYEEWTAWAEDASLIVNSTPLGMHPDIGSSPVRKGEEYALEGKICYDLVYRPKETAFLKQAGRAGAETIGGLEMLIQQGSEAFRLWTGKPFPVELIRDELMKLNMANL